MGITFTFSGSDGYGSIEVPEPRRFYRRWLARIALRLWMWATG